MIRNKNTKEPLIFESASRDFFKEHLSAIADSCLDFKERQPIETRRGSGKYAIDIESVFASSQISDGGEAMTDIIKQFRESILDQSLNFGSPNFLAHPDNGSAIAAVLGDFARAIMHQNLVSHEYSPSATYAEYSILQQIRKLIGYEVKHTDPYLLAEDDDGDFSSFIFGHTAEKSRKTKEAGFSVGETGGAFIFGGTGANFTGLLAAREYLKKKLRKQGKIYDPRKVRILTKMPYAHYSLRRGAFLLGLGNADLTNEQLRDLNLSRDPRIDVKSIDYRMDIQDLERKIEQTLANGEEILCIFALAGDSRMVSFDNLREITRVAEKYDIWVHADGCEGGQCLFSPNTKHLWDGVENVHSISMDPHKVLMLPYSLSIFLLKNIEDMNLIDIDTSLVRLGSLSYGTYTPGVGSKDFASLRLWFMLKHWGWQRLAEEIDHRHKLALEAASYIKKYPSLRLVNTTIDHNAVAFVYYPEWFVDTPANIKLLNRLNKELHIRLNTESQFYVHMMMSRDDEGVVSQKKDNITILRMMFGNPATTGDIIKSCLDEVVRLGDEISNKFQNDLSQPIQKLSA